MIQAQAGCTGRSLKAWQPGIPQSSLSPLQCKALGRNTRHIPCSQGACRLHCPWMPREEEVLMLQGPQASCFMQDGTQSPSDNPRGIKWPSLTSFPVSPPTSLPFTYSSPASLPFFLFHQHTKLGHTPGPLNVLLPCWGTPPR